MNFSFKDLNLQKQHIFIKRMGIRNFNPFFRRKNINTLDFDHLVTYARYQILSVV